MLSPFEKLLVGLVEARIRFITVGGVACVMNEYVRVTDDVDILVENSPVNIATLLNFLSAYGEGFAKELKTEDFSDEEGAIRIIEYFPIDIFTRMGGHRYSDLVSKSFLFDVAGTKVPCLNIEGLILLKQESYRAKDKIDVEHLKSMKKKS